MISEIWISACDVLFEEKSIDALLQSCGRERLCHPGIDHDEARRRSNFPAAAFTKVILRRVIHEEHGVTEFLNTSLKSIGGGNRVVVADRLSVHKEGPIPVLCTDQKTSFYNAGKNEDGLRLFTDGLRRRVAGVKTAQSCLCALVELCCARSPARDGQ